MILNWEVVLLLRVPGALPGEREDLMNLNRKALQKLCHRPVAGFNETE